MSPWTLTENFTLADVLYIAAKMHPKTAIEVCTAEPEKNPYEILKYSVRFSDYCCLLQYNSEPFAFMGLKDYKAYDLGWLITTSLTLKHPVGFLKAAKRYYEPHLRSHARTKCIIQLIQSSYVSSLKFFGILGYQTVGHQKVHGEPFNLVCKEV